VVRASRVGAEAGVVFEGLEGDIFLVALSARLPAGHPVDGEYAAVAIAVGSWPQQILVLAAVEPDRAGVMAEQVDDRGAIQPHIVQRRTDTLLPRLGNMAAQLQAPGLLQQFRRYALQHVETEYVHEQELVLEGKIFLDVAIAAEGIEWVGDHRLLIGEANLLHLL